MNSSRTAATRICGHQDCNERTSRPNHPLCYEHYQDFQEEFIDECPNCSGVYKPAEYPICRSCYTKEGQPSQRTESGDHRQPQNDDRGWNQQPHPEARETAPVAVKAVQIVRQNMSEYSKLDFIHSGSIANDIDKAFDDSRCGFLPVWGWG